MKHDNVVHDCVRPVNAPFLMTNEDSGIIR